MASSVNLLSHRDVKLALLVMCARRYRSYRKSSRGVLLHKGDGTYTGVKWCSLNDRNYYEIGVDTKPMV